jgi:NAD(P)-dependent dehydrogenase (short-subunit alcohol dehydrogenase family)
MWPFGGASFSPAKDIAKLDGKVILVTGGNNGIGKETILQLAKHSPRKIFLASRSESKGRDAIADIKSQISSDVDIEYLSLDLASFSSVKAAANQVLQQSDRLDILVLNAGIAAVPPGKTASGHDIQFGTNHIGHFLLTKLLLPRLQETGRDSDVRIIAVSSEVIHNLVPDIDTILSTEKLTATGPWARYAASKAANAAFAAELARRYPTLTAVSLHPGVVKTDIWTPNPSTNFITRYGPKLFGPLMFDNTETGALTQLWAAAGAKKEELVNGAYYIPVGKLKKTNWASDVGAGRRIWEWTEKELSFAGY